MIMNAIKCKIKVICHLPGVFPEYQPEIGKVYDAEYATTEKKLEFCVINVSDKRIVVRKGEFEVVEFLK